MNIRKNFAAGLTLVPLLLAAQPNPPTQQPESPPVHRTDNPAALVLLTSEQRLYVPPPLVTPDQARAVLAEFKPVYEKLGRPRLLFYVNRELVAGGAGELKPTKRQERVEADRSRNGGSETAASERITADQTYEAAAKAGPTLADRQTVRDVERLFGRPFRNAGATLVDHGIATALIDPRTFNHFAAADNDQARREREALTKVADVVIEVLISTRKVTVVGIGEDRSHVVPDIQATAIRLSDSAILGQATARDVLGRDSEAGRMTDRFDVNDLAEATALALMEDIAQTAR